MVLFGVGAPGEIRTPDPQIRSLVLYPAELRAPVVGGGTYSNRPAIASPLGDPSFDRP